MAERKRAYYSQKSFSLDSELHPEFPFQEPIPFIYAAPHTYDRVVYQTSPVPQVPVPGATPLAGSHSASNSPPSRHLASRRACFAQKSISIDVNEPEPCVNRREAAEPLRSSLPSVMYYQQHPIYHSITPPKRGSLVYQTSPVPLATHSASNSPPSRNPRSVSNHAVRSRRAVFSGGQKSISVDINDPMAEREIFGRKDVDGFYQGEINKRIGYVPFNLVRPMSKDEAAAYIAQTGGAPGGFQGGVPSGAQFFDPSGAVPGMRSIPRRPYYMSDSYRYWPHTNSDPSLVSNRLPLQTHKTYQGTPSAYSAFLPDEVGPPVHRVPIDRAGGPQVVGGPFPSSPAGVHGTHDSRAARRSKWKQKSHSLDCYDGTDRDEYSSHTSDPPPMSDRYPPHRRHYYPPPGQSASQYDPDFGPPYDSRSGGQRGDHMDHRYGSMDRAVGHRRREMSAPGRSPSEQALPNSARYYPPDRAQDYDYERHYRREPLAREPPLRGGPRGDPDYPEPDRGEFYPDTGPYEPRWNGHRRPPTDRYYPDDGFGPRPEEHPRRRVPDPSIIAEQRDQRYRRSDPTQGSYDAQPYSREPVDRGYPDRGYPVDSPPSDFETRRPEPDRYRTGRNRNSFRKEGRDKMQQVLREATKEPAVKMIALYDYNPTETSPNPDSEVELDFRAGDVIMVYGGMDDDGFYVGEVDGRLGLVPSNFLSADTGGLDGQDGDQRPKKEGVSFDDDGSSRGGRLISQQSVDRPLPPSKQSSTGSVGSASGKTGKPAGARGGASGGKPAGPSGAKPAGGGQGGSKSGGKAPTKKPSDAGSKGSPASQRKVSAPAKAGNQGAKSGESGVMSKVLKKIVE